MFDCSSVFVYVSVCPSEYLKNNFTRGVFQAKDQSFQFWGSSEIPGWPITAARRDTSILSGQDLGGQQRGIGGYKHAPPCHCTVCSDAAAEKKLLSIIYMFNSYFTYCHQRCRTTFNCHLTTEGVCRFWIKWRWPWCSGSKAACLESRR